MILTEISASAGLLPTGKKELPPGVHTLGQAEDCAVRVLDASVSRHHARLTISDDGAMLLEDLGSTNGVFVDGTRISQPVSLLPNQTFTLGTADVLVQQRNVAGAPGAIADLDVTIPAPGPATSIAPTDIPPEIAGTSRYQIERHIAEGGMGAVMGARQTAIRREVAMKVMLSGADADSRMRFIEEAQITGQLEHPNIVPVHDLALDDDGQPYYTMKLVKGTNLHDVIEALGAGKPDALARYTLPTLLTVFQKVCDALAFAHSHSVIHRDLKPANIMVGEFGEVLLMDWGLAKLIQNRLPVVQANRRAKPDSPKSTTSVTTARAEQSDTFATMNGSIMGTPQFMSPEQIEGDPNILDSRSDIFALGAILYNILTLKPPFTGKNVSEVLDRVQTGRLTHPKALDSTTLRHLPGGRVPDSLKAVVRKALATEPRQRYRSVTALQADLAAYQGGFATRAENAGAWKQFTLLIKRNKAAAIGSAAVLLVGAIFGTQAFIEGRRAEQTLEELRGTAPTFEAQARALVAEGKLDDALSKIGYAIKLAPESVDYQLTRAHLLQSTQHLTEAAMAYRQVLSLRPEDLAAETNLELCEMLLAEKGGATELPLPLQGKLLDALISQQRDLEAAPLAKLLKRDKQTAEATIRARLASYATQPGWTSNRIQTSGRGYRVGLEGLQLGDLNVLRDLPIVDLGLHSTSVTDLRPLAGLPLEVLRLSNTRVSDLSPLRGMALQTLEIHGCNVTDLSPLVGMPLKELSLGNNKRLSDLKPLAGLPLEKLNANMLPMIDLSPLRGLPLKELLMHNNDGVVPDFSPIHQSATLERISLPSAISDLSFLTTLPKLQQVEWHKGQGKDVWLPTREFLAIYGPEVPEIKAGRAALASAGLRDLPIWRISADADHHLQLGLGDTPIKDLAPLRGLPVSRLILSGTDVVDLDPLRGMPLQELNLTKLKVRNIEPLRGMPLRQLNLAYTLVSDLEPLRGMPLVVLQIPGTEVNDVAILADIPSLEEINLPKDKVANLERLRTLPNLRYLSSDWNFETNHPAQTAEEFWKAYDATKATGK
jgi:serine/threonine protein kinase